MDCLQLAGRGRQLIFGSLNKFLVAAIQQPPHFTAHQNSRMNGKCGVLFLSRTLCRDQDCCSPMLAHQHAACDSGIRRNIKRMRAQDIERLIEARFLGRFGHGAFRSAKIKGGFSRASFYHSRIRCATAAMSEDEQTQGFSKQMETIPTQTALGSLLPDRIGSTPLLRLEQVVRGLAGITLLGKAEWANPGGSGKDRAAAAMVRDAQQRGLLVPGKTILDATSGNTGIALAMLGAALHIPVQLAMPSNVSPERKRILRAYGAEVDWTDPDQGSDGAIRRARELAGNDPARFCYLDQYSNDANWLAHYHTTGPEILAQTAGQVTHFIAGLGTTGTFMGTSRRLKEHNPAIQAISFQPDSPFHGLEGLKHMATAIVPTIYDPRIADHELEIETEAAYDMAKRLARNEGLLVGISAAAAVVACAKIAREEAVAGRRAVIVTLLPDSADKYLSER